MAKVAAVMQPYFAPYAGYWRLLAASDVFVIYDCVQFPRRGWVHRNRFTDSAGQSQWLTLPLAHAPFDARIDSLVFAQAAAEQMAERMRPFPALRALPAAAGRYLALEAMSGRLVDYLDLQIRAARELFGFSCEIVRSSDLAIDEALRGQDRILAILRRLGASDYVNAPGGRDLYDADAFAAEGLALHFLSDFAGGYASTLERLTSQSPASLAADIRAETPALG